MLQYEIRYWTLAEVSTFHFDLKFSDLVGCLASDSNSKMLNSTDDHNIGTDSSPSISFLRGTCAIKLHQEWFCCSQQQHMSSPLPN